MTMLAQAYLEAPDLTFRKGISGQLLYAGFNHAGYKQPTFMTLTKGVAEEILESLLLQA